MAATAQSHLERAELEAVLESGIFHRAPNLASFLRYICERYFEGDAGQIKEYSIAVDALGRPSDFDQKKDSIVRVEAHRLRKRLNDYYAGEGANHPVRILIPNGQYSPQFRYTYNNKDTDFGNSVTETPAEFDVDGVDSQLLQRDTAQLELNEPRTSDAPTVLAPVGSQTGIPKSGRPSAFIILLATAIAGIIALAVFARIHNDAALSNEVWKGSLAVPVASDFRFLAGYHGLPFQDRQGRTWQADAFYTGGQSRNVPSGRSLEAVPDPAFLRSFREGTFQYDIPVRDGTYEVHLYFAETQTREPAAGRLFRIALNGRVLSDLFDVAAEAGGQNRLLERVYKDVTPAEDRKIHISFQGVSDPAILYAAEILASAPGRARPVRVVASETSVIDADGQVWSADQYSIGGRLVKRTDGTVESRSKQLFEGERYGNFSYHIPLAPGKYRVRLFFAETWFGSKLPFAPSELVGARVFNVFANGVALLRDFDIAREAQGSKKGIEKAFENLEPNAQGKIVLEFVPVRNYAEVNAIEVTQMR
ncbi:MAG: malectin domain-containing carbohydrate-binding protein [Bryobacteraceae bacterium]